MEKYVLEMTEEEHRKLRMLLDKAGDCLRGYGIAETDKHAEELAEACDHWLEIIETL